MDSVDEPRAVKLKLNGHGSRTYAVPEPRAVRLKLKGPNGYLKWSSAVKAAARKARSVKAKKEVKSGSSSGRRR